MVPLKHLNVRKSVPKTTQQRHTARAGGLRFCWDPIGVVECLLGHATRGVGIRGKFFLLRNRGLQMHVGPSMYKGKFGPPWSAPQRVKIRIRLLHV